MMGIKKRSERSGLISPFISLSLFASVFLMFWLLPRIVNILYPTCWFVRNVNTPSIFLILLMIPAFLALGWLLARTQEQPFTLDGIGTKLVGRWALPDSGGYIATKWLVVVFLPLIPVRSYRIVDEQVPAPNQVRYLMEPLERLHWEQIRETAWKSVWGYIIFILLLSSFGIWAFRECL